MAGRRPTIGFLTANIHIGSGRAVWPGVADAACRHDANLLCFPGGGLGVDEGFESQRNAIYGWINAQTVDALVSWSSTVGGALSPVDIVEFHRRFSPLPVVGLSHLGKGTPALMVDSYRGMRDAVAHLIEAHGCRRLAFIRGPERHIYAQERYRAYTDALHDYGIPFEPRLVTPPLQWEAGAEAVQVLLDERGLRPGTDLQAIVAVSDLMALDALRALQARNLSVPADVALVGFNDSAEGRLATPPLTSVALPFHEQGARAAEAALALLAGVAVPEHTVLSSRLVVRQSCGCPSQRVVGAALRAGGQGTAVAWAALREEMLAAVEAGGRFEQGGACVTRLLDAIQADLAGDRAGHPFLAALENALGQARAAGVDVAAWQGAVSALRRHLLPGLAGEARLGAEDLFGQARVLIGEAAQRDEAYHELQAARQAEMLREIGQALITTFDVDRLADVLAERLPRLGITSAYLALYESPASSLEQARLVLAYTERGRIALEPGGRRFASRQLVPAGLLPDRRHSLVVEPLFFGEEQLGFALFEIGPRDGSAYEVLRGHLSSAVKGALLFREAQQARIAAEKADRIKTRLLANVSHELRTPLNIILGYTQGALSTAEPYGIAPPPALLHDLAHIQHSAEHQLRVINDLLDLSRAEIDALDLYMELLDPRPLLEDAFRSMADRADPAAGVDWRLELPERLPVLQADPVRLRQILLNLLGNAAKFTERGHIALGAEVLPPHLHIWVEDTGTGIPTEQRERIFEPFVTAEQRGRPARLDGIGLGLSITRRLVALHGGSMALDSVPGHGSVFHVYLPLPSLGEHAGAAPGPAQRVLLLVSAGAAPSAAIAELARRQGLVVRRLLLGDDLDAALAEAQPAALAWDLAGADPADWALVRRLHNHPRLCRVPFILYGRGASAAAAPVLTGLVVKQAGSPGIIEAIEAACPADAPGPILIVDDEPEARAAYSEIVARRLPGHTVRTATGGEEALAAMAEQVPCLVLLDLMMPGMDGFDLLDRMRADEPTRRVPVVILSSKALSLDDVRRLEPHAHVALHAKGMLSEAETLAMLNRALVGSDQLPAQTSALVKRAVAFLHQNYARPLARWEIAQAVGASEDYLSRVFSRELGLSPWEYLNRFRILRAKALLRCTDESIKAIAHRVGFRDQAYFSRVFRSLAGTSPNAYREQPEP